MATGIHGGSEKRVHRAKSADGTEVVGRVIGQGPPVVLLPAGPGSSETSWGHVVPALSRHCTCYLMDTRNRGLSEHSSDLSPQRLVEDVVAYAESIGQPVGLVGWGSALWVPVVAEKSSAFSAVAAYEPGALEKGEEIAEDFENAMTQMGNLAAEGRLIEGARGFVEASAEVGLYTEVDLRQGGAFDFWEEAASDIPVLLQELQLAAESELPSPTDPSVLARVSVPVMLLRGSNTGNWFVDSVEYVADHLPESRIREISGAGHFGPYTKAQEVAEELANFFGQRT